MEEVTLVEHPLRARCFQYVSQLILKAILEVGNLSNLSNDEEIGVHGLLCCPIGRLEVQAE